MNDARQKRKQDIEKQVSEAYKKLNEYEQELEDENDAGRKSSLKRKIDQIKAMQEERQREIEELDSPRSKNSNSPFIIPQPDVSTFVGREDNLKYIKNLLIRNQRVNLIGISGLPGVGKSAFVCHFAEQFREHFTDGVIGLRVDGKAIDVIAREFAQCCGVFIDKNDNRSAASIMQEIFRNRHILLIFDNADQSKDITKIKYLRPGGDRCTIIVTSRDRGIFNSLDIPIRARIHLDSLSSENALDLLKMLIDEDRVSNEETEANQIIQLVGCLPLALQIVGGALQMQPWRSLSDYAKLLGEAKTKLPEEISREKDAERSIRASFHLSLRLLEPEQINFFACLSVCSMNGFSKYIASTVSNCNREVTEIYLTDLYRLSLLNFSEKREYEFGMHPLIHLFAHELTTEELREQARERHADYIIKEVKFRDLSNSDKRFVTKDRLDDIMAVAEWLEEQQRPEYDFAQRLIPFFSRHGYWEKAVEFVSRFQRISLAFRDWEKAVSFQFQQAKFLSSLSQREKAHQLLLSAVNYIQLIEPLKNRQYYEAVRLNILGGILQRKGDLDSAIEAFKQSVDIGKRIGNQRHLAMALNSLGGALQRHNHLEDAIKMFNDSALIEGELGNEQGLAVVLNSLGKALHRLRHFKEAEEVLKRSEKIRRKLNDRRSLAIVMNTLGEVQRDWGHFPEAIKSFEESAAIDDEIGNKGGAAKTLNSLGKLYEMQNQFDQALQAYQDSANIKKELNDQQGLAMTHTSRASIFLKKREPSQALIELEGGFDINKKLKNQQGLEIVLPKLVEVLLELQEEEKAIKYCEQVIKMFSTNRNFHRLHQRICYKKQV